MRYALVTREQPSFQAPFEGHIVLLCTKVMRQRVPDCRTVHSECSAVNSGEPVSWHHHHLMCGWPKTLPACNIGNQCATVDEVPRSFAKYWLSTADQCLLYSWAVVGSKPCVTHSSQVNRMQTSVIPEQTRVSRVRVRSQWYLSKVLIA